METTVEALTFLKTAKKLVKHPMFAMFGEEDFLKRQVRDLLLTSILNGVDPAFAVATHSGDNVDFSTVRNDLETIPLVGPARIVLIEEADSFVSNYREPLERYLQHPSRQGVLLLDLKSFPETTRLAKALPDTAKIACKAPAPYKLADWCRDWCQHHYRKQLTADAAGMLVELIGTSMGQLDQELSKLSLAVADRDTIEITDVDAFVVRSRGANVFHILDAIGEGDPGKALAILATLFADGEDPYAILGAVTAQLRRLAAVNRLVALGQPLETAMDAAGIPKWPHARKSAEMQLRHLGRRRLDVLTSWMIDVQMGIRGDIPLPPRLQIERLIVKLGKFRSP
jgi:DNA polymerase-3 subunit delta